MVMQGRAQESGGARESGRPEQLAEGAVGFQATVSTVNAVLANPYANAVIRVHAVIRPCKFGEPGG